MQPWVGGHHGHSSYVCHCHQQRSVLWYDDSGRFGIITTIHDHRLSNPQCLIYDTTLTLSSIISCFTLVSFYGINPYVLGQVGVINNREDRMFTEYLRVCILLTMFSSSTLVIVSSPVANISVSNIT